MRRLGFAWLGGFLSVLLLLTPAILLLLTPAMAQSPPRVNANGVIAWPTPTVMASGATLDPSLILGYDLRVSKDAAGTTSPIINRVGPNPTTAKVGDVGALTDGPWFVAYRILHASGNASGFSPALAFTLDTDAPATPTSPPTVTPAPLSLVPIEPAFLAALTLRVNAGVTAARESTLDGSHRADPPALPVEPPAACNPGWEPENVCAPDVWAGRGPLPPSVTP